MGNGIAAPRPDPTLSRADQLACYIARHYHEPLTAEMIAKANNLHPNYAMNLFRQAFGTTITTFIRQHRITHAQRLLVTTSDSILDVAMAAAYWRDGRADEPAVFDYFFRKAPFQGGCAVFAGLETLLEAVKTFRYEAPQLEYLGQSGFANDFLGYLSAFSFHGTIWSAPEGEAVFPLEPVLRAEGGLIATQIIETLLLNVLNCPMSKSWLPTSLMNSSSAACFYRERPLIYLGSAPRWPPVPRMPRWMEFINWPRLPDGRA